MPGRSSSLGKEQGGDGQLEGPLVEAWVKQGFSSRTLAVFSTALQLTSCPLQKSEAPADTGTETALVQVRPVEKLPHSTARVTPNGTWCCYENA